MIETQFALAESWAALQQEQARLAEQQRELGGRIRDTQEEVRQEMWRLVDRARQDGLAVALGAPR